MNKLPEKPELNKHVVNGSASIDDWDYYYDDDDEEGNDECCDDCGCYHGHHPWCWESDDDEDW